MHRMRTNLLLYLAPIALLCLPFLSIAGLLQHWPETVQWQAFSWVYLQNILLFSLKQATLSAVL